MSELLEDELLSLQSIWPDQAEISRHAIATVHMSIHADLGGCRDVTVHSCDGSVEKLQLAYLPPLGLQLELPSAYPDEPPRVKLTCSWHLSGAQWLRQMEDDLLSFWTAGAPCIFDMVDHLSQLAMSKDPLELCEPQSIGTASSSASFATRLLTYDRMKRTSAFEDNSFTCALCLEGRKGRNAIVLESCNHVFCLTCLKTGFDIAIAEGNIDALACMEPDCEGGRVTSDEIRRIVGDVAFARYQWLVEKKRFDADPTTSHCPRCSTPAVAPEEDDYATLRQCSNCTFAWCSLCHRSYHGVAGCSSSELTNILNVYLEGDDAQQAELIKRYGKQLINLAAKHRDELQYAAWVKENSQPCPTCRVQVERSEGCAKMVCTRCQTFFCFNCGAKLDRTDPYAHFNSMSSPCYRKLFASMAGAEEEPQPWVW